MQWQLWRVHPRNRKRERQTQADSLRSRLPKPQQSLSLDLHHRGVLYEMDTRRNRTLTQLKAMTDKQDGSQDFFRNFYDLFGTMLKFKKKKNY